MRSTHDCPDRSPALRGGTVSRRGFLAGAGVTVAVLALPDGAVADTASAKTASAGATGNLAGRFARPGRDVAPKFRWWWPDGMVDPAEIRREIDQIADAGFAGAEIAAVHHSIADKSVLDPAGHGWGTPAWTAAVEAALDQARKRGLALDITVGPAWPAAVPTITPDNPAAAKELAFGYVTVEGGATYSGPVPAPTVGAAPGVTVQKLLLVQAARVDTANSTRKETGLDLASVQDLTAQVTDGRLGWTAPFDGQWVLIGYWERGTGQKPESGPHTVPDAYVVDHFSRAGTQALIDYWESRLLTGTVRRLLRHAGEALFEDSLELDDTMLQWTPELPAEFEKRKGYSLYPYLPAIVQNKGNQVFAYEATLTVHVRHDFWDVVSQLLNENHVTALKNWANSIGLKLRAQPYGLPTDAIASAAILDIPEGESLGFKNLDDWRCLAGGRDMAGRRVLSGEIGAYPGGAYNTTWTKLLRTVGGAYAAGLNRAVLHGFSYATAPGATWPGFAAFTPYHGTVGYSESWGPRHPTWRHITDISGYLSRVHQVLQSGTPRADVAVFRQTGYAATGIGASWFTASGVPLGWTHQFISEPLLALPNATVSGGRLAPNGPGYKALFVERDFFAGSARTLSVAAAERLLAFAKAGLPIVFLGDWSDATVPGLGSDADNLRLRAVLAELFAQPTVRNAADTSDVPAALADLRVEPDARYEYGSTLLNAHRVDGDVDYYYFCNGKNSEMVKPPVAAIDHMVSLVRTADDAVPYALDPWTGTTERIALYTEDAGRITVRIALQPGEATIIALARPGRFGDSAARGRPHAIDTEADEVRFVNGALVVRSTKAGTYATRLSDGRTVRTTIQDVPAAITPSTWRLQVEEWRPGGSATQTVTVSHQLTLDGLRPWPDIPELADASGIGRYTTTVELRDHWTGGAYLQLGEVLDTCRVSVNGRRLPPVDQINPVVDVGPYLRRGTNIIEVEVATTLNNQLRVSDPGVYGGVSRQNYGLIGPVQLVPYGEAELSVR